jgi:drug/metabolite transporter (DMT)-like permease
MAILLGLVVAVVYGAADFFGGFASRRSTVGSVTFLTQLSGLVLAAVFVVAFRNGLPPAHDIALSVGYGLAAPVALSLLYRGLATGRMGLVAPLSAVGGAVIPVAWGLARGERPSAVALAGVVLAVVAVVLIAGVADHEHGTRGPKAHAVALGLGAGVGFGVALVCFSELSTDSGLWPVFIARATAVAVVAAVLVGRRATLVPSRADVRIVAVGGVLDVSAAALLVIALRKGLVTLVAPVASLYPATTVLLAWRVLREPIGRGRVAGLLVALVALLLISVK